MCNSYWGSADSTFGTCLGVASPESLSCAPATLLFVGGSRKQEMRDCKGIRISLSMSLQPEERRPLTLTGGLLGSETGPRGLSTVPVSRTMGLPLRWIFFMFHLYRRSFAELGSCCAWPFPRRGSFSQVKPESQHHRCHVSVCSSVLCLVTTNIWSDGH